MLLPGVPAAHRLIRLMLLPSRPDMVHRRRLHGTRQSTPLTGTCLTGTRLKTGIQPCCSGLQVQGTAISPSGATAYSIRSFVRFCKCKECKFVNLSQIGAGFRRKREPRGAGGKRNPREVAAAFLKLYPISLYDARAAEPDGIGNLVL